MGLRHGVSQRVRFAVTDAGPVRPALPRRIPRAHGVTPTTCPLAQR